MGVYIDMEMPTGCGAMTIKVWPDGQAEIFGENGEWKTVEAVPVPPHGRLIDADEIPYKKIMLDDDDEFYYGVTQPYIDRMPTIIPAEGDET